MFDFRNSHKGLLITFITLILASLLMFSLAGCGGQKPSAEQKEKAPAEKITLRFPGTLPLEHHITKAQEMFKKLVEERTNGQVTIEIYPAGQLYTDKDLVDVVPRGGVEMAEVNTGMWTGLVPELGLFDIMSYYENPQHVYRCQDDPEIRAVMEKSLEQKANVKLIGWLAYTGRGPLTVKPVEKMEDWKGLKIRAHSEWCSYWLKALGASPIVMSSAEVYQALQRKTIDGVISGGTSYVQRKLYETAKYGVGNISLAEGIFAIMMNKNTWAKLPKDVQDVLLQAAKETTVWCRQEAQKQEEESWKQLAAMPDFHVVKLSDQEIKRWQKATVAPQQEIFSNRVGKDVAEKLYARVEALREK
jgi:TRAP-type C4-dicarboxylate transport system substrate-binding protein